MFKPYPHQEKAISMTTDWFKDNKEGNLILNLPGGSGKSLVIAFLCEKALKKNPNSKILMTVDRKELVKQNYDKIKNICKDLCVGIYSAALNQKNIKQVTYSSIQSIYKKSKELGHIDLLFIDEVQAVSEDEDGIYRQLINGLLKNNPKLRIIGLSATPFRTNEGLLINQDNSIFKDIIEPTTINELVDNGYLCPLISKHTEKTLETDKVKKHKNDFVLSDMDRIFNTEENNEKVVKEIINRTKERKHILVFCSSVNHAKSISEIFNDYGINADYVSHKDKQKIRDQKILDFNNSKIKALCNVDLLTTGYDFPALDCICFLRGTMSARLYIQMAVRGMRVFEGKKDCLVLDFAGNVARHGPITDVTPPHKIKKGSGDPITKYCEQCFEIVHAATRVCPECGFVFPIAEKPAPKLHNDDIMGKEGITNNVKAWRWSEHISVKSGKHMLKVYYFTEFNKKIAEYITIAHEGYAGEKARKRLAKIVWDSKATFRDNISDMADELNRVDPPRAITYRKNGKFYNIDRMVW